MRRTLIACVMMVGTAGCSPIAYTSSRFPVAPTEADAVAIYPFVLQYPHDEADAYVRTNDLVRAFRQQAQGVLVVGPEEFRVTDPLKPPREGSSLVADASMLGIRPERTLVLRAQARRKEETYRRKVTDFHGNPDAVLEASWTTHEVVVELLTLDGTVLARTRGEAWERGEEAREDEPHPRFRKAVGILVKELYATARPVARITARPGTSDVEVRDTHRRFFALPDVARRLPSEGAVERDVAELNLYRRLDEPVPAAWLGRLRAAGQGVVVVRAGDKGMNASLRPGDVVVALDGKPVLGVASFERLAARSPRVASVYTGEGFKTVNLGPRGGTRLAASHSENAAALVASLIR